MHYSWDIAIRTPSLLPLYVPFELCEIFGIKFGPPPTFWDNVPYICFRNIPRVICLYSLALVLSYKIGLLLCHSHMDVEVEIKAEVNLLVLVGFFCNYCVPPNFKLCCG